MKILQIAPPWIDTPPVGYGGTEWVIYNLVEELVSKGHNVTLFATGNSKTSAKLKYIFKECLKSNGVSWNAALPGLLHYDKAIEYANKKKFDLVHFHLSADTDLAILPLLKNLNKPYILTHHSNWPFDKFSNMNEYYLKYYSKDLKVVNISSSMQRQIPKEIESLGVVYNGINFENLTFNPNPSGDYLTWLGSIEPKKGVKEMIETIKKTNETLIFAGKTDYNPEYFENEIKPLIDNKQIQYIGVVNAKQRNELLQNAKGFVNFIQWEEPFGMVMAESLSCGTPVISISKGAAPEIIVDKKTGFLVSNQEEMIEAIKNLNTIDRAECRKSIEKKFSSELMTKKYLSIYRELINKEGVFNKIKSKSKMKLKEILPLGVRTNLE